MLTLSKSSWHYRFARFMNDYRVSENLCPYVRQVIYGMMKFSVLWLLFSLQIVGTVMVAASIWTLGISAFWASLSAGGLLVPYYVLVMSVTLCVIIFGSIAAISIWLRASADKFRRDFIDKHGIHAWLKYEDDKKNKKHNKPPKEPNIFIEWLKAKHNKICPQLTFK